MVLKGSSESCLGPSAWGPFGLPWEHLLLFWFETGLCVVITFGDPLAFAQNFFSPTSFPWYHRTQSVVVCLLGNLFVRSFVHRMLLLRITMDGPA